MATVSSAIYVTKISYLNTDSRDAQACATMIFAKSVTAHQIQTINLSQILNH